MRIPGWWRVGLILILQTKGGDEWTVNNYWRKLKSAIGAVEAAYKKHVDRAS